MPDPPWKRSVGVGAVVDAWQDAGSVKRCLAAERALPAREAVFEPLPDELSEAARRALAGRNIRQLYSHQVQAIRAALEPKHVVVATPTASGKSLCFHIPVLERLARDPKATALYLYPTKALSRDQEHGLLGLLADAGLPTQAMVYDGDTPGDARRAARERCRVVLTNPDMLHSGILPSHARWASLFEGLTYVVLDELHTYRGVFGSHMAHVLARLRRVAAFHGKQPTFLAATATIGNPREHAARLFDCKPEEIALVDRSGAPAAAREVYVYNPPIVNADLGIRGSTLKHSVSLAADLVEARVPTLVFGPSRNSVEVMLKYLRARVGNVAGPEAIMGYRGGYLPETRRRVEAGLRNGEILCVVATNALELGIDIGDLDAVVCAGYPGSIAATWQRFGRAGRRGDRSVALLVCSSSGLDQYLASDPEYLFRAGAEEARIDPSNLEISLQHLKCAVFEAPYEVSARGSKPADPAPAQGERHLGLDLESTRDALDYLASLGVVHASDGRYHFAAEAFPASNVSLRNIGWDNFVIIDVGTGKSLAELDYRAAHTMLHEQAIYQHDAEQYQVERLDFDNHKAFVRKVEPDYFTTALTYRTVSVLETAQTRPIGRALVGHGDVKVLSRVTGYKKIKFFTHENAGYGDVHLPEIQMHTTSFWLTVPERIIEELGEARSSVIDALRALGSALETVSTLFLMCEPRDLGQTLGDGSTLGQAGLGPADFREAGSELAASGPGQVAAVGHPPERDPFARHTGQFDPTLFLFDAHAGGVGFAPRIYEQIEVLLERVATLVSRCACGFGCPACIGPSDSDSVRKKLALQLLARLQV
ncbi:MAG TPA: DEAD/DEAH box helicase [Polyangiaceae bacterium]|nr:DEAD/DEAH box helicase [Polyangiaceae bacterium]